MQIFSEKAIDFNSYINGSREPDFNNLLRVLRREAPKRPTLFEFFMNDKLYANLIGQKDLEGFVSYDCESRWTRMIKAYKNAGYDYITLLGSDFRFKTGRHQQENKSSMSLNEGAVINDRESYAHYEWPDPDAFDYSRLESLKPDLPEKMKIIVMGPCGVLENVIALTGYEALCYMLSDNPSLAVDIFEQVGSRLVRYYEICAAYDSVGALVSNDDWGFNTQTMLSPEDMRTYVFPWHKKIVEVIHALDKPAILHSCGSLDMVMQDIIEDMRFDAKHSYEDNILPVEEAYEKWGDRIAVLGGIDLDFICKRTPSEIYNRCAAMLERTKLRGGYALGSGNSIPEYVPQTNYLAMIAAAYSNQ